MHFLTNIIFFSSLAVAKINVTVIDTGINIDYKLRPYICEVRDFTGEGMVDKSGHGTNVTGLITNGLDPSRICISVYKFYTDGSPYRNLVRFKDALYYTKQQKPSYLNLSLSGAGYDEKENLLLKDISNEGTTITVAAGNEGLNLEASCWIFPACHKITKNYHVIGAAATWSNKHGPVEFYGSGEIHCYRDNCKQGTSQETAIYLNNLLKSKLKGN